MGVFLIVAALITWSARASHPSPAATAAPSHVAQYLSMLALLWGMVWFALAGMRGRGVSLREIIGGRWRSVTDVLVTLAWAIGFLLVARGVLFVVKAGLAALGQGTAGDDLRTLAFLGPHGFVEYALWLLLSLSAGFCEEVVFRGYLQRQFAALTRNRSTGLVISAVIFGIGHAYQGWRSATVIFVFGLLFGLLAHVTRTLRPGIVAHALQDVLAGLVRF